MWTRPGQTAGTLADLATVTKLKDGIIHNSLLAVGISVDGLFFTPNAKPGTRICVAKGVPTA